MPIQPCSPQLPPCPESIELRACNQPRNLSDSSPLMDRVKTSESLGQRLKNIADKIVSISLLFIPPGARPFVEALVAANHASPRPFVEAHGAAPPASPVARPSEVALVAAPLASPGVRPFEAAHSAASPASSIVSRKLREKEAEEQLREKEAEELADRCFDNFLDNPNNESYEKLRLLSNNYSKSCYINELFQDIKKHLSRHPNERLTDT